MHTKHKLARFAPLLLFAALSVLLTACPGVSGGGNNSSAPQITSFTASQTNVAAGTQVTLNWVITGVPTSLSLKGSDGTNLSSISGVSTTVTPTATTTYTLTATNSSGSDDAMTTVTVGGTVTPPTDGSRTVSFGVSLSQTGPFTSDADGSITAGDPRIVNVPASGGTFYAQVTYSGPAPVTGVTIYLANRSPADLMADLVQDTDVKGFTLQAAVGVCPVDGTQTSITCVYPIKVAAGTPNITALPGVSGEFAYVLRTRIADTAGGDPYNQPPRGYVTVGGSTTPPPTNPPPTNPPPVNPPPVNPPPTNPPVTPPGPTAPKINSFKADPSTIISGQSSTLSWSTSGTVTSLSISGVGSVTGTSTTVSPTATTTYTLTASNGSASTTAKTKVTVKDNNGGDNKKPTADFTSTSTDLTVKFTSTSKDSDGTIASYAWNFGDNTTSTEQNPSKTYATADTYDVTLVVTDNDGAPSASVTKSVTVPANIAPTARYTYSVDGLKVDFNGTTSSDADGTIASYSWNFGDGTSATGPTPSRTYNKGGKYTVVLTVIDDKGGKDTETKGFTLESNAPTNEPPTASFTFTVSGLTANFNASGSGDSDGNITKYEWNFGDSKTGTGATPNHIYAAAGDYKVALKVIDDQNGSNDTSQTVTVSE